MKLNRKIVGALALVTLGATVGGAGTFAKYTGSVSDAIHCTIGKIPVQ